MCSPGWTNKSFARTVFPGLVFTTTSMSDDRAYISAYKHSSVRGEGGIGFIVGSLEADGRFQVFDSLESREIVGDDLESFLEEAKATLPVAAVLFS